MTGVVDLQSIDGGIDTGQNTTNRAKQFTSTITAGSVLIACVSSFETNPSNLDITDDKANVWTLIGSVYDGNSRGVGAWYCRANAGSIGAAPTITVDKGGIVCGVALSIYERGVDATTVLDVAPATATNVTTGPAEVALPSSNYDHSEVMCVLGIEQQAYVTCTPLTGFTDVISSTNTALGLQHRVQTRAFTANAVYTPGWTLSADSHWNVVAFILRGTTSAPTITGISTPTPSYQGSLTLTGVNFGAAQGGGGVSLGGAAQTVTSWADTSVTVTVARGSNAYGAALALSLTTGASASSNNFAGVTSLLPQAGWNFVTLGTPNPTSADRITALADLASGDQLAWDTKSSLVTVANDATFSADASVASFNVEAWTSGSGWGSAATQNLAAAAVTAGAIIINW